MLCNLQVAFKLGLKAKVSSKLTEIPFLQPNNFCQFLK